MGLIDFNMLPTLYLASCHFFFRFSIVICLLKVFLAADRLFSRAAGGSTLCCRVWALIVVASLVVEHGL